jgi:hypothetical protein
MMRPRSALSIVTSGVTLTLLLAAFLLRLDHVLARFFHVDEYISMLAAQMTALRGAPILPSGMLYHQGLLPSYLAVPFILLSSRLSEEMMRWPSLLAGMLAVAGFYLVARRLFSSRLAGLFALTLAALDMPMILWASRVRMYALAGLFVLLGLYFVARGTILDPRPAYRIAAVGCFLGAVLSHSVIVVALPVWVLAGLIVWVVGRQQVESAGFGAPKLRNVPRALRSRAAELITLSVVSVLVVALGLSVIGQVAVLQPDLPAGSEGGIASFLGQFLDVGVSWQRIDDYVYYYTTTDYWPLAALAALALVLALVALARSRGTRHDLATLLLALIFVLTILEMSLVLVSTWRKTRYLFVLCQPAFLLLAADGLARLGHLATLPLRGRRRASLCTTAWAGLGVALLVGGWGWPSIDSLGTRSTGDYDTAFAWVKQQWQAGDQVMTVHPSAAYLYLGRSDYYVAERRGRVLFDEDSDELVDRYVGSTLIDSVDALNKTLATAPGRLWFVVDVDRLFDSGDPLFTHQVFAQMDVLHNSGGVPVFHSHRYPRPVAAEPPVALSADFAGVMELGGYGVDFSAVAPDGTVQLALYWRPHTDQFSKPFKVFVQLRDDRDQIITQADHFPLGGLLTQSVLSRLIEQGAWLRDSVELKMPNALPSGRYRLMVGLYDPDTFERVPLAADASGENAAILERLSVP